MALLAQAYTNRGIIYAAQGNLDQAIVDYTKAIEAGPEYIDAYYNRGLAHRQQGLKTQAIADFETCLRLAPSTPNRAQIEQWITELKGK